MIDFSSGISIIMSMEVLRAYLPFSSKYGLGQCHPHNTGNINHAKKEKRIT
jgi:hypothetical protein